MANHPDRTYTQTIIDIITYGAKVGYTGPHQLIISDNLASANEAPEVLTNDLEEQIASNRLEKVNNIPSCFICSPLGLVPKANGGWRRIHHLSYPESSSVNDHIPEDWGSLEYTSFDEAIRLIEQRGPGCILIKRDFADAFRHIPVAKSDWWLLGFKWQDSFWMDKYLPFGLRTSPFLFDLFAKGINWILYNCGWKDAIHYLDDFLIIVSTGPDAEKFDQVFHNICKDLGMKIKLEKNRTGTTCDFLGIEIDTALMEARLPSEKLLKAKTLVSAALNKKAIPRKELDSLLGFLCFAARVVKPGRAFLRRLFNATASVTSKLIHLNKDMRADLLWWHHFLPKWNGIHLLNRTRHTMRIWTDASGSYGMGGFILSEDQNLHNIQAARQAFSTRFTTRLRAKHINVKEMTAILQAMKKWLPICKGSHLILYCDSYAVTKGVNKTSIRGQAMHALRAITMLAALHDIQIEARWISSKENYIADLLSRGLLKKLADKIPQFQALQQYRTRSTPILVQ